MTPQEKKEKEKKKKVSYQEVITMLVDFTSKKKKKRQDCDLQESSNCRLCWEFDTHSERGGFDTIWGWIANISCRFSQTVNHNNIENNQKCQPEC